MSLRVWLAVGMSPMFLIGGSIEGHITNSATGAGIQGVHVIATTGKDAGGWTMTDDNGAFQIDELADGEYTVTLSRVGYFLPVGAGPCTVKVAGTARFEAKMLAGASLRGRVLDPEGKAAEGIVLHLGRLDGRTPSRAVTDEIGAFVFEELEPGGFVLSATAPEAEAKDGVKVVTTYYPSVVEPDRAQRIRVERTDLSGYDIRLQSVAVHKVSGVVEGAGQPVEVRLFSRPPSRPVVWIEGPFGTERPEAVEEQKTSVADDGTFELKDVPEGEWVLRAVANGRRGSAEVRVGRDDPGEVKIRLQPAFSITNAPEWGSPAPTGFDLSLFAKLAVAKPLQDGFGFPGQYWIWPQRVPSPYYLAEVMMEGRDVRGQVVEIDGPVILRTIYKTDGGSVRGTVREHNGAGAAVVLMADATGSSRLGYSAKCDDSGAFVFREVPPGNYKAAVYRDGEEVRSLEFLNTVDARGERVKVVSGSTETVELTVK